MCRHRDKRGRGKKRKDNKKYLSRMPEKRKVEKMMGKTNRLCTDYKIKVNKRGKRTGHENESRHQGTMKKQKVLVWPAIRPYERATIESEYTAGILNFPLEMFLSLLFFTFIFCSTDTIYVVPPPPPPTFLFLSDQAHFLSSHFFFYFIIFTWFCCYCCFPPRTLPSPSTYLIPSLPPPRSLKCEGTYTTDEACTCFDDLVKSFTYRRFL